MKTITMTDAEKNRIAIGTEVVATRDTINFSAGDVLVITKQDYDYVPAAIKKGDAGKFAGMYIHVDDFSVLDTSTTASATTAVKLLPGERPKYGVVYTVTDDSWTSAIGWEVVLGTDDGTFDPWFVRTNGRSMGGFTQIAITLDRLTYEPEQTATPTPEQPVEVTQDNLAFGQVYRMTQRHTSSENVNVGDLLVLIKNDGSNNPFFTRLGDGEKVVAYLNEMVAVNVIESKQSKELET